MSIPAPLWLVWGPVKLIVKATGGARKRRIEDRRAERRDEKLVAALGHGAPPVDDTLAKTEPPTLQRWAYLHRRAIAGPAGVAAGLAALSTVMGLAPTGYSSDALLMAGVPPLVVVGAGWAWLRTIDPKHTAGRAAAISATAAGVAWLVWPPFAAVPSPVPGARWWILALAVAAGMGIRELRFRTRPVAPPVIDMSPPAIWSRTLGDSTHEAGKLPGSELVDFRAINDASWSATVACIPGKHGTDEVEDAKKRIAGVFRIKPAWIEVQPRDDYSRPGLIVTKSATLSGYRPFKPILADLDAGTVEMATYPDGSRGLVQAYKPGQGVKHIWFVGGTGSGKTGSLSVYFGRMMPTGLMVLDLADLGETSLPAWAGVAFRSGSTVHDGLMTLRRANAVMDARKAWMKTATWTDRDGAPHVGISTLDPSPEWPIYTACMEEFPEMHSEPEAIALADRIGRLGRKYDVQIIVVTQPADLKGAFGNADALRMNIQRGGNVVALSNESNSGTQVFGGTVKVNLGAIPLGQPGLGYIIGPANYRAVMGRIDYIEDKDAIRPPDVMSSFQVAALAQQATLNPIDLAAIARVEEEAAAEADKLADAAAEKEQVQAEGIGRDTVARALRKANREAGGPVRLNAVSKAFITPDMDEVTRKRVDDTVRKALGALVEAGAAGRPERGMYEVAA